MEFETVVDDFLYQQRKLQIDKIQEAYSVGTVNQLKFNSALYQREFLEQESPCIPRQRSSLMVSQRVQKRVREVQQLLLSIQARLMKETVECIAPLTEKMVHLLWKIGIFNFFAIGMFIHCQILEVRPSNQTRCTTSTSKPTRIGNGTSRFATSRVDECTSTS
jgi:hypothetical protein